MSSITKQFGLLTLAASAVLAVPYNGHEYHGHVHRHLHSGRPHHPTGSGAPYGYGNGTGPWGTGSGYATGTAGPTVISSGYGADGSVTSTATVYSTSYVTAGSVTANTAVVAAEDTCSAAEAVTVTATNTVTVTATAGSSAEVSAEASSEASSEGASLTYSAIQHWHSHPHAASTSSSETLSVESATSTTSVYVAPTTSSSTSVYVAPPSSSSTSVYAAPPPSSSSSAVAPVETSSTSSSTYVAPSTTSSVYVAPTTSSVAAYTSAAAASSATSVQATSTGTVTSTSGKRGCAYNVASYCDAIASDELTWGWNWGAASGDWATTSNPLNSSLKYVPILKDISASSTSAWSAAVAAATASGSTHIMAFNEPDNAGQSNIAPSAAASAYNSNFKAFYGGSLKLGSPSVSNSPAANQGLDWLDQFFGNCTECQFDFVQIHWYDTLENGDLFYSQIEDAVSLVAKHDNTKGATLWVTEFAVIPEAGNYACTAQSGSQVETFFENALPYLDNHTSVEAYSYYMADPGCLDTGASFLSAYQSSSS